MIPYLLAITKLKRSTLLFTCAYIMISFFSGMWGVLGNLYILQLGMDMNFLGTLAASGQVIWAIAALPAGIVGAHFGLRRTLISGNLVLSLSLAFFLSVPILPKAIWPAALFISYGLVWISLGLVTVNGIPYLMAVSPENERSKAFALQGALWSLAAFMGSLLAGFLPGVLLRQPGPVWNKAGAYGAVLWIGVLGFLISATLMMKAETTAPVIANKKNVATERAPLALLLFLGILFAMEVGSDNSTTVFLNVYFTQDLQISTASTGTIFAFARLLPFILSPLLPLILERWGSGRTLNTGYFLVAFGSAVMAFFRNWPVAIAGYILISIVTNFAFTTRSLFGQEAVHPRWRTTVNAVRIISMAAGGTVAALVGSRIQSAVGFRWLFLFSVALSLLSTLVYFSGQHLTLASRQQASLPLEPTGSPKPEQMQS